MRVRPSRTTSTVGVEEPVGSRTDASAFDRARSAPGRRRQHQAIELERGLHAERGLDFM